MIWNVSLDAAENGKISLRKISDRRPASVKSCKWILDKNCSHPYGLRFISKKKDKNFVPWVDFYVKLVCC